MRLEATSTFTRRGLGGIALAVLLASGAHAQETITVGVTGPLTGPAAQYGEAWTEGFDLALEAINAEGGINGIPLEYVFEDSQNDPRQTVAIAQKFINNPDIVVQLGDFSSTSSMAASPLYQRAGLVQFGFGNSHPDFTKTGDYMWSAAIPQSTEQVVMAKYAYEEMGLHKIAILHLNTDFGTTSKDLFQDAFEALGGEVVATEGYLPEEKDFRATLTRVKGAAPDGIMMQSYYADGALIARQIKQAGLDFPVLSMGSVYSPDFLSLAGDASEGIHTMVYFSPDFPRAEVQNYVKAFIETYGHGPNQFNTQAFDAMNIVAEVMRRYGTSREDIKRGMAEISGLPAVMFPEIDFDPETRRVSGPVFVPLVVRDGEFVIADEDAF